MPTSDPYLAALEQERVQLESVIKDVRSKIKRELSVEHVKKEVVEPKCEDVKKEVVEPMLKDVKKEVVEPKLKKAKGPSPPSFPPPSAANPEIQEFQIFRNSLTDIKIKIDDSSLAEFQKIQNFRISKI